MLLHDYLRRKDAILTKAKIDLDNLLTEIADVPTRKTVEAWEPGDPIPDSYDAKKPEEAATATMGAVDDISQGSTLTTGQTNNGEENSKMTAIAPEANPAAANGEVPSTPGHTSEEPAAGGTPA